MNPLQNPESSREDLSDPLAARAFPMRGSAHKTTAPARISLPLRLLSLIPMLFMLCLIFGFSAQDGESSGSLSLKVSSGIVRAADAVFSLKLSDADTLQTAKAIQLYIRKLAHMTEYFLLTLSLFLPVCLWIPKRTFEALDGKTRRRKASGTAAKASENLLFSARRLFFYRLSVTFPLAVLCAALDEFHQSFVPERCGTPVDVLIDSVGSMAACLLLWLGFLLRQRSLRKKKL